MCINCTLIIVISASTVVASLPQSFVASTEASAPAVLSLLLCMLQGEKMYSVAFHYTVLYVPSIQCTHVIMWKHIQILSYYSL